MVTRLTAHRWIDFNLNQPQQQFIQIQEVSVESEDSFINLGLTEPTEATLYHLNFMSVRNTVNDEF